MKIQTVYVEVLIQVRVFLHATDISVQAIKYEGLCYKSVSHPEPRTIRTGTCHVKPGLFGSLAPCQYYGFGRPEGMQLSPS